MTEYITAEKKIELEKELARLAGVDRKEVLAKLEYAKSLGDLSENAEYHEARDEQGKLEDRIQKIEHILKNSTVVTSHHADLVEVGTTVTVSKKGGDKKVYKIVGAEEADMIQGKISNQSPLGAALFGKKKGDTVSVHAPAGTIEYTIVSIE